MVPISRPLRVLMLIVIAVSVPEGLALLLGPVEWYPSIWGWGLTPMTARFTAGLYLSVALGFAFAYRETDWQRVRIPLAMLWSFALIALVAAVATNLSSPTPPFRLERPFSWVWIFLYVVSVAGGLYYQFVHPRKLEAEPAQAPSHASS